MSNSKAVIAFLILGLVLGGGGTFFILNQQHLLEKNNYEQEISQYSTQIQSLQEEASQLGEELSKLEEQNQNYSTQIDSLENNYEELLDDYELLLASLPLTPQKGTGNTIQREYQWYYQHKKYDLSLSIPENQYDYYKELDRAQSSDYSVYVTHPFDDEYINTIIKKINFIAIEEHLTEEEKINLVISFVQSLPYTVDSVTTPYDEYPRYPLETLIDNGGDCEDTSILAASLLNSLNYDIILIAPPEHMAVGVYIDTYGSYWTYEGQDYYYLETTGEGWEIGELPDDYAGSSAYLYPLNPTPLCTHNWTAEWNGLDEIDLTVTVTNHGSAMAENYKVYSAFDAGDDYVWYPVESKEFDLNIGNSFTVKQKLEVPTDEYTRLIVKIIDSEGYSIDTSYSEWFDT
jgi:hypothetical protein